MHPRIKSFIYAFKGLIVLFKEEPHARFHLCAAIVAIVLGIYLKISTGEWLSVIFCIGLVIATEAINSAIENLGDAISKEYHVHIEKAKDLGAAGVLLAAVTATIVGGIIFIPKFFDL